MQSVLLLVLHDGIDNWKRLQPFKFGLTLLCKYAKRSAKKKVMNPPDPDELRHLLIFLYPTTNDQNTVKAAVYVL